MTEAEALTRALGGVWRGAKGAARCPAHDDRSPSLSLGTGWGGRLLLNCHAGCSFEEVRAALQAKGHLGRSFDYVNEYVSYGPAWEDAREERERRDLAKRARKAQAIWDQALPIRGTVAERYVRLRGITAPLPPTLRYIGACWHLTAKRAPAMVARVTGADGVSVHRTYLAADGSGKADLAPQKTMLGPTKGGAVHLSSGPDRLVVAEGIETSLSLISGLVSGSVSVWAALSAGGMRALRLPERAGRLLIAPDGDDAGRAAARDLAERANARGWEVSIMAAPEGRDWNDVLTTKAVA